jgi:hypothetical protein
MFLTICPLVFRVLSLANFMSPPLQHKLLSTILLIIHMFNDASTAALVPRKETG